MFKICDIPSLENVSSKYDIKINGVSVKAYKARVSRIPFNRVWPGHQRDIEHTEFSAFIVFDTDEQVEIEVTPNRSFSSAVIRPQSKNIALNRNKNTLTFSVFPGDLLSLELDGHNENLQIFANKIKSYPKLEDENVIYFGPGTHDIGQVFLKDNETMVIDSGAIVYGSVVIKNSKNVRICGHGILCNSTITRTGLSFESTYIDKATLVLPKELQATDEHKNAKKVEYTGCLKVISSENVLIDGIVFRDSSEWTATVANSVNVTFDNVKAIGMWRYNADGIDFCNCKNGVIRNSFLRTFDDVIVVKGLKPYDSMNTEDLLFENNVIWCDWGRGLEIGAETCADEIRNITFKNCDIIHGCYAHMDIQNGDRGHVHDILFENISVEYSKYELEPVYQSSDDMEYTPKPSVNIPYLFYSVIMHCYWSQDDKRGVNSNIALKNIDVLLDDGVSMPKIGLIGLDSEHLTSDITIENLTVNKKHIVSQEFIEKNEFTDNIKVL